MTEPHYKARGHPLQDTLSNTYVHVVIFESRLYPLSLYWFLLIWQIRLHLFICCFSLREHISVCFTSWTFEAEQL